MLIALCALISAGWIIGSIISRSSLQSISVLSDLSLPAEGPWPKVSILIPARDEEEGLEVACQSVLAIDYPELEIILINDRSADRTAEIMAKMTKRDPRIIRVDIDELPSGWIGKTNALQQGLKRATGEWILFTDADVLFEPQSLKKAICYCVSNGRDHLSLFISLIFTSPWIASFVEVGFFIMGLWVKFSRIEKPEYPDYMGMGGFQLVRRKAYDETPGLEWLKMEPIEDMAIALMLKKYGKKISLLGGRGQVRVNWYPSLGGLFRGAGSRSFALSNYRYLPYLFRIVGTFVLFASPVFLLFCGPKLFCLGAVALASPFFFTGPEAARCIDVPRSYALLFPFGLLISFICLIYSLVATLRDGGVRWRGRVYGTAELRLHQRVKV